MIQTMWDWMKSFQLTSLIKFTIALLEEHLNKYSMHSDCEGVEIFLRFLIIIYSSYRIIKSGKMKTSRLKFCSEKLAI